MITLQFVCTSDLPSRLIAWWGNGWHGFSHVDAVLPDNSLLGARSNTVGGQPPGVHIRPPDYAQWIRVSRIGFNAPTIEPLWLAWLDAQVGRQYDQPNIWDLITGQKTKQDGRWICSALQAEGLVKFELISPPGVPVQQITPDTLHAVCCGSGAVVIS